METIRLRLRLDSAVAAGLRRLAWNRSISEDKFVGVADVVGDAVRHYLEVKGGAAAEGVKS